MKAVRPFKKIYVRFNTAITLDLEDAEKAHSATRRWKYAHGKAHGGKWTNLTYARLENGKKKVVRLGRFIAGFPKNHYVTYVNRNRKDMRKRNLKVGGVRMDLNLPEGLTLEAVVENLEVPKIGPAENPVPVPAISSCLLPGGARHFVPDPTSRLGPIIQYKIWLKKTGNTPRGSTNDH